MQQLPGEGHVAHQHWSLHFEAVPREVRKDRQLLPNSHLPQHQNYMHNRALHQHGRLPVAKAMVACPRWASGWHNPQGFHRGSNDDGASRVTHECWKYCLLGFAVVGETGCGCEQVKTEGDPEWME